MICEIAQCYYNRDSRCLKEERIFFCPKGRDSVKVRHEDDVNVTHSGSTVKMSRISVELKGRYANMLAELKGDGMYYAALEEVIKAGIEKMWFELNARRKEI